MSAVYDCTTGAGRAEGVRLAAAAVQRGEVIVLPTDTVYGVGADAFNRAAVAAVLAAKGRGRDMPPPVLVATERMVDGLATGVPAYARSLIGAFWPGPLTLVLRAQPSLVWDLGETNGTVAMRMPQDQTALDVLGQVGPMAVTSANRTGEPPATTVTEAAVQLGSAVEVYLDGGPSTGAQASTIVDCTRDEPVILRQGALSAEQLHEALAEVVLHPSPDAAALAAQDAGGQDEPGGGLDDPPGAVHGSDVDTDGARTVTVEPPDADGR